MATATRKMLKDAGVATGNGLAFWVKDRLGDASRMEARAQRQIQRFRNEPNNPNSRFIIAGNEKRLEHAERIRAQVAKVRDAFDQERAFRQQKQPGGHQAVQPRGRFQPVRSRRVIAPVKLKSATLKPVRAVFPPQRPSEEPDDAFGATPQLLRVRTGPAGGPVPIAPPPEPLIEPFFPERRPKPPVPTASPVSVPFTPVKMTPNSGRSGRSALLG